MKGHKDGSYSECQFVSPQGACKVGDALYVVDSVTHHLRKASTDYHYNSSSDSSLHCYYRAFIRRHSSSFVLVLCVLII